MVPFTKERLRLYLVTDRPLALGRDLVSVVEQAVSGGVTLVQLREKDIDTREFVALGRRLKEVLAPTGVPLLINDRIDVALAVGADGVHIGQSDMSYADARALLGSEAIIGLSVENEAQALEANAMDLQYIALSPVYLTGTKTDTSAALGLEGVRRITALSRHPSCGIGSMNADTAADVIRAGADGIAVVSAIMSAPDPRKASATLSAIVNQALQ